MTFCILPIKCPTLYISSKKSSSLFDVSFTKPQCNAPDAQKHHWLLYFTFYSHERYLWELTGIYYWEIALVQSSLSVKNRRLTVKVEEGKIKY